VNKIIKPKIAITQGERNGGPFSGFTNYNTGLVTPAG
jgi:hypothetical protein